MKKQARAIANNDIVYLWWTYSEKIPDCLGFTVRRSIKGKPAQALPAFVGFNPPTKTQLTDTPRHDTDEWPVQAYQWKDLFVPEETDVSYEIVPLAGAPGHLSELEQLKVKTRLTRASDDFGPIRVVFNRGIISTQALAKKLPKGPSGMPKADSLRAHIENPNDAIRKMLGGEAIDTLPSLLRRARKEKGTCFLALYELTDQELIAEIEKTKGHVRLILSNADSSKEETGTDGKKHTIKLYDETNRATRKRLAKSLGTALHDRLLPKGNYIGHNKFVVYVDKAGTAKTVLTGSTNWTATGLCAQSNNTIIIDDAKIARHYLDYWNLLLADAAKQAPPLRTADAKALKEVTLGSSAGKLQVWFSPNTKNKTKPAKNPVTPPDMKVVFDRIRGAKAGVLFLVFSPGSPSILSEIKLMAEQRTKANKRFFVRGAISDERASGEFATHVYNDSALERPNLLVTGIGGIPDHFSFWQREIAKLGHAVIHDKIIVIDPFTDNCCVITGSHNQGFKASYSNDENFVVLSGNRAVAEAYTAHVLDVVNHYNWRYRLLQDKKQHKTTQFVKLEHGDIWQDKYFEGDFLASRDKFFFPGR